MPFLFRTTRRSRCQALEAGWLRVLEGQVVRVTGEAIVFRLPGRAGARVASTLRTRG